MYSFRKEALDNAADYNIMTVVMVNNKTDFPGASQWVSDRYNGLIEEFIKIREDVIHHKNGFPSWGETADEQVQAYIDGLGKLWLFENATLCSGVASTRSVGSRQRRLAFCLWTVSLRSACRAAIVNFADLNE